MEVRNAASLAGIDTNGDLWIGYVDFGGTGKWKWIDNTGNVNSNKNNNFTLWYPGEPNYHWGSGDGCTHIEASFDEKWADNTCTRDYYFVCGLQTLTPTMLPTNNPTCIPTTIPTSYPTYNPSYQPTLS